MKLLVVCSIFTFVLLIVSAKSLEIETEHEILEPVNPSEGIYQEPRIVFGYEAFPKQFPYMAHILSRHSNVYKVCGGSVISANHVLTAAHCLTGVISATIGLGTIDHSKPRVSVVTSSYQVHPQWNPSNLNNDIGIYFLPVTLSFDDYIKPIRLPTRNQQSTSFERATARVCGYGTHSTTSSVASSALRYVDVRIISNEQCSWNYGSHVVVDSAMCALGYEFDEQGTCYGDSGGPLTIQEGNAWTQIGVISFISSRGCGSGRPYGFARSSSYIDWVQQVTGIPVRNI